MSGRSGLPKRESDGLGRMSTRSHTDFREHHFIRLNKNKRSKEEKRRKKREERRGEKTGKK
jgi:hypothetical protein